MNTLAKPLPEFVKELPPDLQLEVRDFAEFLLEKRKKAAQVGRSKRRLGTLKDSVQIIGDIIEPVCAESDWEVLKD